MRGSLITGWRATMLLAFLAVIALTLVVPHVDLPDTAFHEDSAPAIVKSRMASVSALVAFSLRDRDSFIEQVPAPRHEHRLPAARPMATPLPILLSALLC